MRRPYLTCSQTDAFFFSAPTSKKKRLEKLPHFASHELWPSYEKLLSLEHVYRGELTKVNKVLLDLSVPYQSPKGQTNLCWDEHRSSASSSIHDYLKVQIKVSAHHHPAFTRPSFIESEVYFHNKRQRAIGHMCLAWSGTSQALRVTPYASHDTPPPPSFFFTLVVVGAW